ncbi:MAG: hypothetical protein K2X67_09930 [Burkholderiales bacterium]|nr:hypothetical protein [Burkholderiales bacterium]
MIRTMKHAWTLSWAVMLLVLWGCQSAGTQAPASGTAAEGQPAPVKKETKSGKPELFQGYTCCNLHHEDDWISDANYATLPMVPLGTPTKVMGYGRYRVHTEMGGKKMRLGLDYGRKQQTLQEWAAKMIVPEDPKVKLATFPPQVQDAIKQGRVAVGMTKEQVIMSVGYPLANENPSLDAPMWRMWVSSFGEYQLVWDRDGKVKEIVSDSLSKNIIEYRAP